MNENTRGLLIFEFGGHARSVADVALAAGVKDICFVDGGAREGESFLGFPVIKQWRGDLAADWQAFSATGDHSRRQEQCEFIKASGWALATVIAPSATIGVGCKIAEGCFIAHHAHIGPMATVGVGCIVNTSAVIDHESTIGDYTHISVNSTIAGRVRIGSFVMIGAGATVIDGIEVANNVTIGAGAVVHQSLSHAGVYVGIPARRIAP